MYRGRYWADDKFTVVEWIAAVADEVGLPLATWGVAWVAANPLVAAPIIGASHAGELAESIAGADATLDAATLDRLDELTRDYRVVDVDR